MRLLPFYRNFQRNVSTLYPYDHAVGVKVGMDIAVHTFRGLLHLLRYTHCLLCTDWKDAFGTILRRAMRDFINEFARELLPLFTLHYGLPSLQILPECDLAVRHEHPDLHARVMEAVLHITDDLAVGPQLVI